MSKRVPRMPKKVWIVEDGLILPVAKHFETDYGFFYTKPSKVKPRRFKAWVREGEETKRVVRRLRAWMKSKGCNGQGFINESDVFEELKKIGGG